MRKRILIALAATAFVACAAKGPTLREQLAGSVNREMTLQARVEALEIENRTLRERLSQAETRSKGELVERVQGLEAVLAERERTLTQAELKGYYMGMNEILQSVEIRGIPTTEDGLILNDHFYTFVVRVGEWGGHMLVDCDDPLAVHKFCSTYPAFEFQARPVIPVEDAVRVELEAIDWRDGLKGS